MANFVFNVAKGRVGGYIADVLAGGNDAIIWIPMATSGTEAQGQDLATFAAVEADANFSERTGTGWSRITQDETGDGLAYTADNTDNEGVADSNDLVWAAPSAGATVGLVACYDPDTTVGTDSDLVPLVHLDMAVTPNGQQVTYQHNVEGWFNAT